MITEDQLEQLSIQWFQDTGWNYVKGKVISPEGEAPEREDFRAVVSLTTKLLGGVKLVLPGVNAIQRFDFVVNPIVERIVANLQQSRSLTTLRDTLLPELLGGNDGLIQ